VLGAFVPRRVALYIAAALVVVISSFAWIYEMHLSPEFHAQLVQLKESTDKEQEERKRQMDGLLAERQLSNAQLEVDNACLDVRIAEPEGRNSATERQKLRSAENLLRTLELSESSVRDLDALDNLTSSRPPASDAVYAALLSHVNTLRDRLVMKHFRSLEAASTELGACDLQTNQKTCNGFERQIQSDRNYINAAIDGKY
jgi:hypothetical protein